MHATATGWTATYVNKRTKADGSTYMDEETRPVAVWTGPNDGQLRGYVAREEGDREVGRLVAADSLSGLAGYTNEPGLPILDVLMQNALEQRNPWYEVELTTGTTFVGSWNQGSSGSFGRLGFILPDERVTHVRTDHISRLTQTATPTS